MFGQIDDPWNCRHRFGPRTAKSFSFSFFLFGVFETFSFFHILLCGSIMKLPKTHGQFLPPPHAFFLHLHWQLWFFPHFSSLTFFFPLLLDSKISNIEFKYNFVFQIFSKLKNTFQILEFKIQLYFSNDQVHNVFFRLKNIFQTLKFEIKNCIMYILISRVWNVFSYSKILNTKLYS